MKTWNWLVVVAVLSAGAFALGSKWRSDGATVYAFREDASADAVVYSLTKKDWSHTPSDITLAFRQVDAIAAKFGCSRSDAWVAVDDLNRELWRIDGWDERFTGWAFCADTLADAVEGPTPLPVGPRDAARELATEIRVRKDWLSGSARFREMYKLRYN